MEKLFPDLTLESFLGTALMVGATIFIAFVMTRIVRRIAKKHFAKSAMFAVRVINIVIMCIGVLTALMQIPSLRDLAVTLFAGSGVAAVVIGLAAQEAVGNIICGFVIAFTKPFAVGDYIELQNGTVKGVVQDIFLRHTTILSMDNRLYVVPNSVMNAEVLHSPRTDRPYYKAFLDVSVAYGADIDLALKLLHDIVAHHPQHIDLRTDAEKAAGKPPVTTRVLLLGESSVTLRAIVVVKDLQTSYPVLSDMRYSILKEYAKHGVEIPYPYINVIQRSGADETSEA